MGQYKKLKTIYKKNKHIIKYICILLKQILIQFNLSILKNALGKSL